MAITSLCLLAGLGDCTTHVIDFENLIDKSSPDCYSSYHGAICYWTVVNNQYVYPKFNDVIVIDFSESDYPLLIPGFPHSGNAAIEENTVREGSIEGDPHNPIEISFDPANRPSRIKVWAGLDYGTAIATHTQKNTVIMRAYDASGQLVGQASLPISLSSPYGYSSCQTPLEIKSTDANIARATIGLDSGINTGLAIDDVEFDTFYDQPPSGGSIGGGGFSGYGTPAVITNGRNSRGQPVKGEHHNQM